MEQAQAGIGDEPAAAEVTQARPCPAAPRSRRRRPAMPIRFTCSNRSHARRLATPASVIRAARSCRTCADVAGLQHSEPASVSLTPVRSRRCSCGMRRQVSKASIGQLSRPAQPQSPSHARGRRSRASTASVIRPWDSSVVMRRSCMTPTSCIPLGVVQLPPWRDGVVRRVDLVASRGGAPVTAAPSARPNCRSRRPARRAIALRPARGSSSALSMTAGGRRTPAARSRPPGRRR